MGDGPSQPADPNQPTTLGWVMAPVELDGFPHLGELSYLSGSGQIGVDLAARFPPKVVTKIENLEFVKMSDLVQEAWAFSSTRSSDWIWHGGAFLSATGTGWAIW